MNDLTGGADVAHALAAIAKDPELGPDVMSDTVRMGSLLGDYLPDATAARTVLLAAVYAGVPGMLTARADMPAASAVRLAAAAMAEQTGYPAPTAEWAARAFAVALGMAAPDPTDLVMPGTVTTGPARVAVPPSAISSIPLPVTRTRRRWPLVVALAVAFAVAAGATAYAALLPRHETPRAAGHDHPARRHQHHPATGAVVCSATTDKCSYGRPRLACLAGNTPGIEVYIAPHQLGCDTNGPVNPPSASSSPPSGLWTSSRLVITPRSLGAVTLGMTQNQASAAAGVQLVQVGDGVAYPSGSSALGLAAGGFGGSPGRVVCVAAFYRSAAPVVVSTPQGFILGGTVAALKSLYGSQLQYERTPPGPSVGQGYVLRFPGGDDLAFDVSNGTVTGVTAGRNVYPGTCG